MRLRPLERDDLGKLLRLWNDSADYDPMTVALFDEKVVADDDVDPGDCVVAAIGDDVAGFAIPVLRRGKEGPRGYVKLLAVARARQRQGIGRALLERCEDSLRRAGARTVRLLESAPNYLVPGIDYRDRGAICFAEACGYEPFAETCNLAVDLEDAPLDRPAGDARAARFRVRRARAGDYEAAQTFVGRHWAAWQGELAAAFANAPPTLYLAFDGAEVVGFAAFDANNRDTGWFGPMGVGPAARGSGTGCRLLRHCLAAMRAQGREIATIPWVGPVGFYEKCVGARRARTFRRFEKTL